MGKKHPYLPSPRKAPLLTVICSYAFSGINVLAAAVRAGALYSDSYRNCLVCLGIIFLLMIPLTLADNRKDNRSARYAVYTGIMHLGICVYLAYVWSGWWVLVYLLELLAYLLAGCLVKRHYKRTKRVK